MTTLKYIKKKVNKEKNGIAYKYSLLYISQKSTLKDTQFYNNTLSLDEPASKLKRHNQAVKITNVREKVQKVATEWAPTKATTQGQKLKTNLQQSKYAAPTNKTTISYRIRDNNEAAEWKYKYTQKFICFNRLDTTRFAEIGLM